MSLDATLIQETDIILTITVTDGNGSVVDLTGASITWGLQNKRNSIIVLTKEVGSGVTITDATNGIYTVTLTDADTSDLIGCFMHGSKIVDVGGLVTRVRDDNQNLGNLTFKKKMVV